MKPVKQYIKSFISSETVAGVDIFLLGEEMHISYINLQRKDDKVTILNKNTGIKNIKEIAEQIPQNYPVQISINGKGFVTRTIELQPNEPIDEIIHQIIPGADIRQMYYTLSRNDKNQSVEINIVRKEIIDHILLEFKNLKLFVTQINPGTSALIPADTLLDSNPIKSKYYSISTTPEYKLIHQQSEKTSMHTIAEEKTEGNYILPFGAGLGWFLKYQLTGSNLQKIITKNKEEYFAFKKLRFSLITGLAAIFLILLINFLSFGALTKKSDNLNRYLSRYKNEMESVLELKQEVSIKENYLFENNLLSGTKMSYYSDRIGILVPKQIKLTELNIHPSVQKKNNYQSITSFQINKIIIRGNGSLDNLQKFIQSLEEEQWISDVDLENYNADKQQKTVVFSLIVFIKE